ncbi:MAG: rubrerythrin family protein [Bacteroidales bacterium]|jgi:rubrerythrin|nr:rubrerythrin family protein [Bacteroidales bacterium]MCU0408868.1 rubrerythrin family protein [Bacteroidales bacterium]
MEKSIKGTETEKNLLKAFAGESQAKNRYEFAAKVAKEEGYEQIAGIFLETALQEQQHAKRFFKFLEGGMLEITACYPAGKIDTTSGNLLAAAEGEHEEWSDLYPAFADVAEKEGFKTVATAFRAIAAAEKGHEERYRKLLENVMGNKVFERGEKVFWYCRKCGYIHFGTKPLKNCPACLHPESYFELLSTNY